MKIGFTGSQKGMTDWQKEMLKEVYQHKPCEEFIHGDCIGSDEQAADVMVDLGVRIFTIYPPTNNNKRAFWANVRKEPTMPIGWHEIEIKKGTIIQVRWMPRDDYLKRNQRIVDNCELMIATPKEHQHSLRSGTWATIRYAWKVKRDITIIPPIEREVE